MSLFTENIIPGKTGRVFGTDAKFHDDLVQIKNRLLTINGIVEVTLLEDIYPKELIIISDKIIPITLVEGSIKEMGFHLIPKAVI